MTTGEVPPNENKPWFSLIRGWHYIILSVHWKRKSELITVGDRKTIKLQLVFFFFCCLYSGDVPFELTSCVPTNCANKKLFGMVLWLVSFICCHSTTSLGFRWLKFHCTYLVPICVLDEAGHSSWDSKVNQWGVWLGIEPQNERDEINIGPQNKSPCSQMSHISSICSEFRQFSDPFTPKFLGFPKEWPFVPQFYPPNPQAFPPFSMGHFHRSDPKKEGRPVTHGPEPFLSTLPGRLRRWVHLPRVFIDGDVGNVHSGHLTVRHGKSPCYE